MRFLNVWYFITCIVLKKVNFQISKYLLLFSFLFIGVTQGSLAQKFELGGGIGLAAYSGDIIRKIDLGQLGPQVTLFGKRNFDNVWTLRVGLSTAIIQAADSIKPIDGLARIRNARFKGGVIEGSAVMEFNFLDYLRNGSGFRFSPYAFFGIGYSVFIMKGNTYAFLFSTRYNLGTIVVPFGGGIKYRLNDRWTLATELGFRPTLTDYLDKIDSKGPTIPRFIDPAKPNEPYGINFGNPNDKDWYYFLGVTISYTFASNRCYTY